MKSFGIIHIFLLVFLLLVYKCTNAQDFLVTSKGDTVVGQVKPLLYGVDKKIQITPEGAKKKTSYPMFQVKQYRYKNALYQPVKGPDGYTFMKVLISGYLSLYNYQLPNQSTFDGLYMMKLDGKGMEVPNLTFKKAMKNYLEDCPQVVERIDNGDLSKKDLNKIIAEYNQCVEDRTIDHAKAIAEQDEHALQIGAWDTLEAKVKSQSDFDGKQNALDMISEIKGKIGKSEKIPNFLVEGLKSSLPGDTFKVELDNALKEIN